jgi:lysophospholipase L1-like esterase
MSEPSITSFAALGDSFTEGLNDPAPDGQGFTGWADRLAGVLAEHSPEPAAFRYANLAVRGRLLDAIISEQLPRVRELKPDLISFTAGGNDILRPGSDPDALAERFEAAVAQLVEITPRVLVCSGFDTRNAPLLSLIRGKIATYNSHLRAICDAYGLTAVDLWSLKPLHDPQAWSRDRLHLAPAGHERVARLAARRLGFDDVADPSEPFDPPRWTSPADRRRANARWAREHLVPWIGRRLRGESSGDGVGPKRPDLLPL